MPAQPADRTAAEKLAELRFDAIQRQMAKCPDDHNAMKPVPNRRDRRRNSRRKSS